MKSIADPFIFKIFNELINFFIFFLNFRFSLLQFFKTAINTQLNSYILTYKE